MMRIVPALLRLTVPLRSAVWLLAVIGLLCLAGGVRPAVAAELASGSMLGPRYKADRFYVRAGRGSWIETYRDKEHSKDARGKLAIVRVDQGLFQDEWLVEQTFDARANTDALIGSLDAYKAYGVSAVAVSLQGADPRYGDAIPRRSGATYGEGKGTLVSAFEPDGSLKADWMERLEALLRATAERGMFVSITYFHPAQDEVLESPEAIVEAARNVTRWLIEKDFRNVIIDVATEWDIEGEWDHVTFVPRNIANLIRDVRDQFNGAEFSLPIGASSGPGLSYPVSLARACDVVLVSGAGFPGAQRARRLRQMAEYERPLLIIDGDARPDAIRSDAHIALREASGWAFRPVELSETFPFAYSPLGDRGGAPALAEALAAIAEAVLKRPPPPPGEPERVE